MPTSQNRDNEATKFGIVIPKTVSIGAIVLVLCQVALLVWSASKYTASIDRMAEQIESSANEINKIKSDIYTKSEANLQFDSLKREIEFLNKANDKQDSEIKDIRGARR